MAAPCNNNGSSSQDQDQSSSAAAAAAAAAATAMVVGTSAASSSSAVVSPLAPSDEGTRTVSDFVRDEIARAVLDRFDRLPGRGKPQGSAWTVLAGLVAEEDTPTGAHIRVLSLATGTRCLGVSTMAAGRGRLVHDCHAEVLCRRAFHRYLFSEVSWRGRRLREAKEGKQATGSEQDVDEPGVLEELPETGSFPTWRLKQGLRLHFYCSTLPCGECTLVPISNASEGTLVRKFHKEQQSGCDCTPDLPLKDRNRTGAKPASNMPEDPRSEGFDFHRSGVLRYKSGRSDTRPDARTVCYSCSEKICRWNHIGWQGSLLSRLIPDPVAMTSIVVGGPLFNAEFVKEALFDRAGPPHCSGIQSPLFLHTELPFQLSRTTMEELHGGMPFSKVSTTGLSIVWSRQMGSDSSPGARSISRNVPGFHDILIGHTGERQGLRSDRQGARVPVTTSPAAMAALGIVDVAVPPSLLRPLPCSESAGTTDSKVATTAAAAAAAAPAPAAAALAAADLEPDPTDSWVSPLSKRLQAEDALDAIVAISGSAEAAAKWLARGDVDNVQAEATMEEAREANSRGEEDMPASKRRKCDGEMHEGFLRSLPLSVYEALKEALVGEKYRERKRLFHSSGHFSLWLRKQRLRAEGTQHVDRFLLKVPDGLLKASSQIARD